MIRVFLSIPGLDGGVRLPGFRNAFEIADYDLGFSLSRDGEGVVQEDAISAIGLTMGALDAPMARLMSAALAGTSFDSATITVVNDRGADGLVEVERLTLDAARIALVTTAEGNGSRAALLYERLTVTARGFNGDGTPNPKRDATATFETVDGTDAGPDFTALPEPFTAGLQPEGAAAQHAALFVKFDGIKGPEQSEAFRDHFRLSGADLDVQRLLAVATGTEGRLAPVTLDFGLDAPATKALLEAGGPFATIDLKYVLPDETPALGNNPTILVSMKGALVVGVERLDADTTRVTLAFNAVDISGAQGATFPAFSATNLLRHFDAAPRGTPNQNGLFYDSDAPGTPGDSARTYRLEFLGNDGFGTRPVNDDLTDSDDPDGLLAAGFEYDVIGTLVGRREDFLSTFTGEGLAIDLPSLTPEGRRFWSDIGADLGNLRLVMRDDTGKVTGWFELTDASVVSFAQTAGFADRVMLDFARIREFGEEDNAGVKSFVVVHDFVHAGTSPTPIQFDPKDMAPERPEGGVGFQGYLFGEGVAGGVTDAGFVGGIEVSSFALSATPEGDNTVLSQFTIDLAPGSADALKLILATEGDGLDEATFFLTQGGDQTVYSAWKFTDLVLASVIDGSGGIRLGFQFRSVQIVDTGLDGADKDFAFPTPGDDVLEIGERPDGSSVLFTGTGPDRPDGAEDGEIRLEIRGVEGGATDADLTAPFDVLAYHFRADANPFISDLEVDRGVDVFRPLVVDFAPGQRGLTDLLDAMATGASLGAGTLFDYFAGVDPDDDAAGDNRREIDLTGLRVLSYSETNDGSVRVVFAPEGMTITEVRDGTPGPVRELVFDGNGAILAPDAPIDAPPPAAFDRSTRGFLDFKQSSLDGGSVVEGFVGQFDAASYALDLNGVATGGLSSLRVTLSNASAGLVGLIAATSDGKAFPELVFSLTTATPDGQVAYQIVRMSNVYLNTFARGPEQTEFTFGFSKFLVEIGTIGEDGSIVFRSAVSSAEAIPGFDQFAFDAGTNDVVVGTADRNLIDGGNGDDDLTGGPGADTMLGGGGNDTLRVSDLVDSVDGGAGFGDVLDLSGYVPDRGLSVDMIARTAQKVTGPVLTFEGIENVIGTRNGDNILGDDGDNVIEGGGGADTMDGGEGNNTLSYRGSATGVSVDLEAGTSSLGDAEGDSFFGFARVEGSASGDTLTGDDSRNALFGGAGDDVLTGNGDFDTLLGGTGDDLLLAGVDEPDFSGNEIYRGGDGFDTMRFFGNGFFINAVRNSTFAEIERLDFATDVHGGGGRYIFTSTQFDTIEQVVAGSRPPGPGNSLQIEILADVATGIDLLGVQVTGFGVSDRFVLFGREGTSNVIIGSAKRDAIFGNDQGDLLDAGKGNDRVDGRTGSDTLLGGTGNDKLRGGDGRDLINGGGGDDLLLGGQRIDTLDGGLGRDVLTGNAGRDTFLFRNTAALDGDRITDFDSGDGDRIDLTLARIASFGAFDGSTNRLQFRTDGVDGFLEADINGDGVADAVLTLSGVTSFDPANLLI